MGAKAIFSTGRNGLKSEHLSKVINKYITLRDIAKNFIVGFDLVGQEDTGAPLKDFEKELDNLQNQHNTTFYFHAGETNWFGYKTDDNLYYAIKYNTKRIGHAYVLNFKCKLFN